MENIKEKLQSPAFIMFVLYFLTAISIVLFLEKGTFLWWLNQRHNPFGNVFFRYVTLLGEHHVFITAIFFLLAYRYYYAILLASVGGIHYILVQFLKQFVFNSARPKLYFQDSEMSFNVVEGIQIESLFGMPSGHTAAAFTLATLLICLTKNKLLQVIYMLIAILVAISRVYLFQHFMEDTIVGALIGFFISGFFWWYFTYKRPAILYNQKSLQRGLIFNR